MNGVKVLGVRTEIDRSWCASANPSPSNSATSSGDAIVVVGSVVDDKAQLVLTVSKALTVRYKAGDLIRPARDHRRRLGRRPSRYGPSGPAAPSISGKLDEALEAVYRRVEGRRSRERGSSWRCSP